MDSWRSIRACTVALLALVSGPSGQDAGPDSSQGAPQGRKRAFPALSEEAFRAKQAILDQVQRGEVPRPPNVVVLFVDDLGYADLGVHGGRGVPTPRIDALARSGVRCTSAYVTAATCAPSRASLLTGRYQQRFGFEFNIASRGNRPGRDRIRGRGLDPTAITLADVMQRAGYATGVMGKWHLGSEAHLQPAHRGFDEFFGFLTGSHRYIHTTPGNPCGIYRNGQAIRDHDYLTTAIARASVRFIEAHSESPFFLYVPFNAVHVPLEAPKEYLSRFEPDTDQGAYYAMIAALDDAIGMILDALTAQGLDDDTIVVFMNDNGAPEKTEVQSNQPFRRGKLFLYEGGVRVPMFVRWPGVTEPDTTYDGVLSAIDLFPTVCAAAGITLPDAIATDGVDLGPHLRGERDDDPHDTLFWRTGENSAIRRGRWKLIRSGESRWLYDLEADVGEVKNLAKEKPDQLAKLEVLLDAWDAELREPAWPPLSHGDEAVDGQPYALYQ